MYAEALKGMPKTEIKLKTEKGDAYHVKTDVFQRTMWYAYPQDSGLIALTPEQVGKIQTMNKSGKIPKELREFSVEKEKVVELGYENVVGQDSLTRFENKNSARRKKKRKNFSNTNRTP